MKLSLQPASLRESWPIQRLAATMQTMAQDVQDRATAVVDADAARIEAIGNYATGAATIDRAIQGVAEQAEQGFAFLESVSAYNRAIAEYATTVLPPGTPPNKLVAAMVGKRT